MKLKNAIELQVIDKKNTNTKLQTYLTSDTRLVLKDVLIELNIGHVYRVGLFQPTYFTGGLFHNKKQILNAIYVEILQSAVSCSL